MPLANDQMIVGRYLKRAKGRKLLARMVQTWDAGGFVRIGTALKFWDLHSKHRDLIRLDKSGSLYMARGRHWECVDYCSFQFARKS